jgi:phage minor structural protein
MIEVYVKGNEDYGSNGDMTLTPTTCEVELTVEGVAELTLEHPIDDLGRWEYLVTDNVIAAPTPYSKKQLFRIYDYIKTETEVTAYARHVFYDSAGEMLVDVRPTDKTGQEALDIILSGTKYKAKTNIKTRSTAYYIRKNIMEAIGGDDENSFINRWGGERMYDNFTVIINDRMGGDYGACAEFGRNMTGIEADINIDDVVTRIIPESYNGYTLEGEEPWVDSPLIGNYANPRAAVVKFEDVKLLEDCQEGEEGFSTLELLREELKRRCKKEYENGLDKPKVNYKVDLVEIADTDDYKGYKKLTTIGIGDDVLTRDRKLKINVTARCIRLVYDCIEEENTEVELGNYTENYFDKTTSAADIIQKVTREDGTLKAEEVYGKIDAVKAQLKAQRDISQPSEVRAVLFEDLVEGSPTYGAMSIGTMGFCIASERTADGKDWDWKTFGTGSGFYADYICVGQLDGALIKADSIQTESISINYRKSVESHISEAVETSERKYKNTIDELKSDFKKTYTTFQYVDDSASKAERNANNYTDTVGAGAKSYTDEQLKKYVTTTEMTTAISQTAEQIKTEAEKTYTSFQYVDETAGNLADEAEANAKSYADETAAAAADQALADAKADTDGKLKNYVTQVNMKTSIDQSAESVKTYAKKAVDALKHNYIENGTFESGNLDGWKLSDSENIIATNDEYLGNVASITRGTSNIYMYQSWKLKAGTYTVRFKAGADLRSISKARIRVSLGGISYYTKAGELDDEVFKQYETEITISSAGTKYFYVYNYVDNTTVYIKDVEVLGKYEDHAEAQFTVANDAIEAEVKRAEGIEDELRAAIKVNAGNITSKVEKGDMGSYITQYYNNVLIAFNKDSKYVQISAGQIAIYNGEVTAAGKRAVFDQSGNSFYRDNYFVGRIGTNQWKDNNAHKGLTFDLEYQGKYMAWARAASSGATTYDTILCYSRANSIYTEAGLHVGCNMYLHNYELHNVRLSGTGVKYNNTWYNGYTGTIPICTAISIQSTGNGGISWSYSTSYIRVADGVIVGYWT